MAGRNERNGQILYRGNRGGARSRFRGRRVQDDVSGLWFGEHYQTTNDFGDRIDSRDRNSFDYDTGAQGNNGDPRRGPFGPF